MNQGRDVEEELASCGKEGWELVSVVVWMRYTKRMRTGEDGQQAVDYRLFFKRPR